MRMLTAGMLVVSAAAFAAEQPADFAYGLPVKVEGEEALYQVELPAAVYQGVARSDLGDLRVFNGASEMVPHALKPRELAGKTPSAPARLVIFPLKGEKAAGIEGLDLRVQKNPGGMIVNVTSRAARPAGAPLLGYLIDASALKQPLRALDLDWEPAAEGFAGRMRVEASDDLSRWSSVISGAALVNLEFGGQRLLQKKIELPARQYKYLRLSWPAGQKPLVLTAVSGELSDVTAAAPRQWRKVAGAAVADKPNEYEFDLAGQFPLDRLRVALPQQNTVAQAQVLSRAKAADPWRPIATAVLYRLRRQGQEVLSPDIVIATDHDRYWLLRVDARGGGLGAGLPALSAGWVPHHLVFAARGAGPFQLAYGNREMKPAAYAIETLIPGYRSDADLNLKAADAAGAPVIRPLRASAAEPRRLGGDKLLEERIDLKKWSLWGSLFLGVLLLGWMALRLMKQMDKTEPRKQTQGNPGGQ